MRVILPWLRIEMRRRWRSLVVLALLIAISTGTVLAAVAGARRSATAVDRLLDQTLPATAAVRPQQPAFDWALVRALPQVEALATFPGYSGFGIDEAPGETVQRYLPADPEAMHSIERPVILDGRLADPARADEAVVTANFVETYGYGVGDTVTLRLFTPAQVDTGVSGVPTATPPRPAGPTFPVRIVGVVRSPWHSDAVGEPGRFFPSPGLITQYRANVLGAAGDGDLNALVRLHAGPAGLEAFRVELARIAGEPVPDVADRADAAAHLRQVTEFEAACLLAFGLVALLAAVVLVGQSITRYTAATVADVNVLRGPGMTRGQGTLCAAAGPFLAATAGTTVGIGAAIAASRSMPFGAAATVEPAPGVHADWLVLGIGWVLTPALVLAICAAAAWASISSGAGRRAVARRSTMARAAARAGLPVPVVIGTRFALETGHGTSAVPVRPALLGAVTGVLGVLAAFTFSAGVADAVGHPERFGQTHQVTVKFGCCGQDLAPAKPVITAISADPDVAAAADVPFGVASSGQNSVLTFSYDPAGDPAPIVLTDGRPPSAAEDVVLAPTTARRLGVGIGATVPLTGNAGAATLRVVGLGFVPQTEFADYDNGAWVTAAGYQRLFADFFLNHWGFLTLHPGADPRVVIPRLAQVAELVGGGQFLFPDVAQVPKQLAEIQGVRVLPVVLGGFLALLAIGAVGHALATAVRLRRRDVAVLRAVGMTRWQARGVVFTQASVLAGIGLLFGIPLGVALGRTLWRVVADSTPLHYVPPVAFWALALIVPLALLIANLLAALLGRRVTRLRIGEILRAE
ncbi:MAG: ABC transporter permease [Pseudonocardiales bacterium]